MKTADEIYQEISLKEIGSNPLGTRYEVVQKSMIEFAKLHVDAALKSRLDEVMKFISPQYNIEEVRRLILTSYSLTNIK